MPQVKITLTDENYKYIQKEAEKNLRTFSNEINFILNNLRNASATPTSPLHYPPGIRDMQGIQTPENPTGDPYKVTITAEAEQKRPETMAELRRMRGY